MRPLRAGLAALALLLLASTPSAAFEARALESIVSLLPVWPGYEQGGQGAEPGGAPEGSAVAIRPGGYLVTAHHVIERARRIDVRLADGRVLPATIVASAPDFDIALLKVSADLPPLELAAEPALGDPVCAVGNAFGLDLSVSCGVVSALRRTNAGFDSVEDFIQTDAAVNPGASGGALLDESGRMVGLLSAIFTRQSDANIGVNFAISAALLRRVTDDLLSFGSVRLADAGISYSDLPLSGRRESAGARIDVVAAGGPGAGAGLEVGDLVIEAAGRAVRQASDLRTAVTLSRPGDVMRLLVRREGQPLEFLLTLDEAAKPPPEPPSVDDTAPASAEEPQQAAPEAAQAPGDVVPGEDCAAPAQVCALRLAVFPLSGFAPIASATRIGEDLLVTNRHAVADLSEVVLFTPNEGEIRAEVLPSSYEGDLIMLRAQGLPEGGPILNFGEGSLAGPLFAIGADVARSEVRVYDEGALLLPPAEGHALARIHHTAPTQPGNSGGPLVDGEGRLVGILTSGGEGRYEAMPARELAVLESASGPSATAQSAALGQAYRRCTEAVEETPRGGELPVEVLQAIGESCAASGNRQLFDQAAAVLGQAGFFDEAIAFSERALAQDPNSINGRVTMVVTLHIAGRFEEEVPHVRWLLEVMPEDPQVLRFAIQAGKWGGDPELAEEGYRLLERHHPAQAEAARRFLDSDIPAPPRR